MESSSLDKSPQRISAMFDAIASRYDLLNTVLSAGLDRYWRRRAITALRFSGREMLLDVCSGTGDVAIAATGRRDGARAALCIDFAGEMLRHGLGKARRSALHNRVSFVRGDAMRLPVGDASADGATIAFGIRNVQEPVVACRELFRALRAGGRLAILEFGLPVVPGVRPLYLWYFRRVLPWIGRMVSRHSAAYSYLPESVGAFPWGDEFATILREAGFNNVKSRPLSLGIVYLYVAEKGR